MELKSRRTRGRSALANADRRSALLEVDAVERRFGVEKRLLRRRKVVEGGIKCAGAYWLRRHAAWTATVGGVRRA
jgi:hypothetical protein